MIHFGREKYLEFNASGYLDTGILLQAEDEFYIDFSLDYGGSSGNRTVYANGGAIQAISYSSEPRFIFIDEFVDGVNYGTTVRPGSRNRVKYTQQGLFVNGAQINSHSIPETTVTLKIAGANTSNLTWTVSKLYRAYVKRNGTYLVDYIPTQDNGTPCFLDRVSGQNIHLTAGTCTLGESDITVPLQPIDQHGNNLVLSGYRKIGDAPEFNDSWNGKHAVFDGNCYFDTGIIPNADDRYICMVQGINTTDYQIWLAAGRDNSEGSLLYHTRPSNAGSQFIAVRLQAVTMYRLGEYTSYINRKIVLDGWQSNNPFAVNSSIDGDFYTVPRNLLSTPNSNLLIGAILLAQGDIAWNLPDGAQYFYAQRYSRDGVLLNAWIFDINPATGKGGCYDLVSKTWCTKVGTGDIEIVTDHEPQGYFVVHTEADEPVTYQGVPVTYQGEPVTTGGDNG
jgi:hypothetical protein